jgi:Histidine kinase
VSAVAHPARGRAWPRILAWPRIKFILIFATAVGYPLDLVINSGIPYYLYRALAMGLVALLAFGLFEQWPEHLPKPLARWVLQVLGVAFAMPLTTFTIWTRANGWGARPFWKVEDHLLEFAFITALALLLAPWAALAALVRQKEAFARHQALAFELKRSELERQALDARLHLLQAQVAPHFLFNTLANVQALVDAGSPQAPAVLRSLVAYLRAAVPRLNEPATTLGQELQLVQAYLELMHMRMPDRLQFALHVDEAARTLRCPPLTLLTLVENAVRHGIDPSEDGGQITIEVQRHDGRCLVRVTDTGVGLGHSASGSGFGLTTLRERLQLSFGSTVELSLAEHAPHGACAELNFPATGVPL